MTSVKGMRKPPAESNPYALDLFDALVELDGSEPDPTAPIDREILAAYRRFGEHGAATFQIEELLPHINPNTISAESNYLVKRWKKLRRSPEPRLNPRTGRMCDVRVAIPER